MSANRPCQPCNERKRDDMSKRFVSIWFRHLATDWFTRHQPQLKTVPFVLRTLVHSRMVITAANAVAEGKGIARGMVLADARAIMPDLVVHDDRPDLIPKLLARLAEWCIRFSPHVAIDLPDGLMIDASGCAHLWGGDEHYVSSIASRLIGRGYEVRVAMTDTIGASWAVARFGKDALVIPSGFHQQALMSLPPEALRVESEVSERLHKLGLHQVRQFINIPRASLRKRFGLPFMSRLAMALGEEIETIEPVQPIEPFQERLPCLEPIVTATGIEIALKQLLENLCVRLAHEQKGLRTGIFKCYRVDGKTEQITISTNRPSRSIKHLYKLFEPKITKIEPALGIELFVLEAPQVGDYLPEQEKMWEQAGGLDDVILSELIDRLANRVGIESVHRYLPQEHYWPERSFKSTTSLVEEPATTWRSEKSRPIQLLTKPEPIQVTAPIPDYPPMLFRYKDKVHQIMKADGPERIEQEWWLQEGQHRDYYQVEDEAGQRYWLFRLGHYQTQTDQWFLHGFFA